MRIHDVAELADYDEFSITAADLKELVRMAYTLNSGIAPKGEMCFIWGKNIAAIVERCDFIGDGNPRANRS